MLPIAQGTGVVGEDGLTGNTPVHPSSHNGQTGLGQTTSIYSSSITNRGGIESPHKGNQHAQNGVQGGAQSNQGSNSLAMLQVSGLGPHGQGVCNSGCTIKQGRGDPRECSQTPIQQPTVSSKHSLSDPEPKPTQDKAVNKKGQKGITPIPFLNPDLVVQLVGCANEVPVVVDGCEVAALVDSGVQVSNISAQLCKDLGLEIQPLGWLLELEGMGGAAIPLPQICGGKPPNSGDQRFITRMCCCWPSPPWPTLKEFLVMVGSRIIDRALSCMTVGELAHATVT